MQPAPTDPDLEPLRSALATHYRFWGRSGRQREFPLVREHHESERPIKIVWRLRHPMPAEMFEMNRRGG